MLLRGEKTKEIVAPNTAISNGGVMREKIVV
jgi:hypothetical protein